MIGRLLSGRAGELDVRHGEAPYVARNLLNEVGERSDLAYDVEIGERSRERGLSPLEEKEGSRVLAVRRGYRQDTRLSIEELGVEDVDVWVEVLDSPGTFFTARSVEVGVETPAGDAPRDAGYMHQQAYTQLQEDVDAMMGMEAQQKEVPDGKVLEYFW